MALSSELASKFVKVTKDTKKKSTESTVYGTTVKLNGSMYVRFDGSDLLTPVSTTADVETGERVAVLVKNHTATVIGNISSPSARKATVQSLDEQLHIELDTIKDEVTTNLRIESSRGTVFKTDEVATVLSAIIYRGSKRITDITTLREEMGSSAYLQWSYQNIDDETFSTILSTDSRLSDDGFTFTLSPDDVDSKVTFLCQLIAD